MNRPNYAKGTSVDANKSKAEIEQLLTNYGASAFLVGWISDPPAAAVTFEIDGMRYRIVIPMPSPSDDDIRYTHANQHSRRRRSEAAIQSALAQARRERWRALLLTIKGQLVAVDLKIKTLAEAFMAEAVVTNAPGQPTVGEWLRPQLVHIRDHYPHPPLLPGITQEDQP